MANTWGPRLVWAESMKGPRRIRRTPLVWTCDFSSYRVITSSISASKSPEWTQLSSISWGREGGTTGRTWFVRCEMKSEPSHIQEAGASRLLWRWRKVHPVYTSDQKIRSCVRELNNVWSVQSHCWSRLIKSLGLNVGEEEARKKVWRRHGETKARSSIRSEQFWSICSPDSMHYTADEPSTRFVMYSVCWQFWIFIQDASMIHRRCHQQGAPQHWYLRILQIAASVSDLKMFHPSLLLSVRKFFLLIAVFYQVS